MPKSRFNAVREKARASRHNPIHRGNQGAATRAEDGQTETSLLLRAPETGGNTEDVLPVLKSLPVPSSDTASSVAPEDVLWALTSLTNFLSTKALRNELLLPKHDITSRILLQLRSDLPIEVREAASGCLRNLCIEAPGRARKALEASEKVQVCLEEIQRVAQSLKLIEGDVNADQVETDFPQGRDMSFLSKPKSEMNRKERRHAAKAEAAALKQRGHAQKPNGTNGVVTNQESNSMETDSTTQTSDNDAIAATDSLVTDDDEKTIMRLSHLTNLIAVLWCLVEMSPLVEQYCVRSAPILCQLFSRAILRAADGIHWLQLNPEAPSTAVQSGKIDVGRKDRKAIEQGRVEAAISCLNALVTLSDSSVNACAAFVGVSRQELQAFVKGKGKLVLEEGVEDDLTKKEGQENLRSLYKAIELLGEATQTNVQSTPLTRQATSLGLLSLATIRNIQSSLPLELRTQIQISRGQASAQSLNAFELGEGISALQQVITDSAASTQKFLVNIKAQEEGEEFTSKQKQSHDQLNNLNLALEVLAELVGDREGWSRSAFVKDSKPLSSFEADDESSEEAMETEDVAGAGDEDVEVPNDEDVEADDTLSSASFDQIRLAKILTPAFLEPIVGLAYTLSDSDVTSDSTGSDATTSAMRGVLIRALSVLNNAFIVLASYAHPPPSQPLESDAQKRQVTSFQQWLIQDQDGQTEQRIGQIWRWSFELASRTAASPIMTLDGDATKDEDAQAAASEARRVVETCLCIMWSISRCYEAVGEDQAGKVLVINSEQFASDPHCRVARQGNGVIESLIAAYKGSKQEQDASASSLPSASRNAGTPADQAAASIVHNTDGIRVASLGILSTIVRQAHVWPAHTATITALLCQVLEALPPRSDGPQQKGAPKQAAVLAALALRDWTSLDGMVVAVNGLIDTFADETRPWDAYYSSMKLQGKLKRASAEIRSASRSIDKRKHTSLRLAADEAWDNLMGFLQYRESLRA